MPSPARRRARRPPRPARGSTAPMASSAHTASGEMVRAGLHALQERDAAVERWLREAVLPAWDAMRGDPGRAALLGEVILAPEAWADLVRLADAGPITAWCRSLAGLPEHGTPRDELRPGLRLARFDGLRVVAFHTGAGPVTVIRILDTERERTATSDKDEP